MATPNLQNILASTIGAVVGQAVKEVAHRPDVAIDPAQASEVAAALAPVAVEYLQNDPRLKEIEERVAHLTSTEAWYQSRANWSAIVSGLTPLLAIAGYNLAPEDQALIAAALAIGGGWLASYLARRARTASKPLGAK